MVLKLYFKADFGGGFNFFEFVCILAKILFLTHSIFGPIADLLINEVSDIFP